MNSRFKPVLKLTIIFVFAVFISGSILTYLSINNISNLKELTEKKVTEEEKFLADQLSENFQEKLEDVAREFTKFVSKENIVDQHALKLSDTLDFVKEPFIIDRNGKFLWPWFIEELGNDEGNVQSTAYKQNFINGEKAEYIDLNFNKARVSYLASLKESSARADSARSLNALARVSVKMKNNRNAYIYYIAITSKYFSVLDKNGFPYVYYAIPQLLKIADTTNSEKVFNEIALCLSRMASGKIPLNYSTDEILTQISEWVNITQTPDNNQVQKIKRFIQRIRSQITFINKYGELIKEAIEPGRRNENPLLIGRYKTITGVSQGELVLFTNDFEFPAGFTVILEQLWVSILSKDLPGDTEFEYEVELIEKKDFNNSSDHKLVTRSDLSPCFPGYMVLAKLKNEKLIEEFVKRKSWVYGIALTLLLGGMVLGVLLILRDISREKYLASVRSDFVSNVTHELKTPLTSIHMFAESILLGRVKTTTGKKEYLNIILKETERLKRMINNILDFSKREKGKLEYSFKKVDITALVKSALHDLDYWLIEENFSVQTEIEENVFINADPDALKQAMINLLSNAIKYSRNTKEIFCKLIKEKDDISIVVEDKGIGIPEDQTALIFDKFYRIGQNRGKDASGTGLGLTVVKEIVEAHNGKVLIESQINEGSKFTIILNSTRNKHGNGHTNY
jgi:signal transduction histidine kinase